jgi:Ca2+-binding RTX toxin-like protein
MIGGGNGEDNLWGSGGDDTILAYSQNDHVVGGNGTDSLNGGGGDDNILGGSGDDHLIGGQGNDKLDGDNAEPTFGFGTDVCDGGKGTNVFVNCETTIP